MNVGELRALYESYLRKAEEVEQGRKPFDGVFGLGRKPGDDLCHDRFVEEIEEWIRAFRDTMPDSVAAREVLEMMFHAPRDLPAPQSAYWILMAVQGYGQMLIPQLSPQDAAELAADYEKTFPRRERMPVQKQLLAALKQAGKA